MSRVLYLEMVERTGNVDIITFALNMYTHGVDPKLDFSNLPELTKVYERLTRMSVYERQPYTGQLVFAASLDLIRDAIAKGMHWRDENIQNTGISHIFQSIPRCWT